jgi:hypothetical protein
MGNIVDSTLYYIKLDATPDEALILEELSESEYTVKPLSI